MALSEVLHSQPPFSGETILDLLEQGCQRDAQKKAASIVFQAPNHLQNLHGESVDTHIDHLSWTGKQTRTAGLTVAWHLLQQGVQRGSTLATFLPNGIECLFRFWTAAALQLTIAPLDSETTLPGRKNELEWYIDHLRPAVILVQDKAGAEAVDAALKAQGLIARARVVVENVDVPGWTSLSTLSAAELLAPGNQDLLLTQDMAIEDDGGRVCTILFTSGTSGGRPKGCPIRVRSMVYAAAAFGDPGDRAIILTFTNYRAISNIHCFDRMAKGSEIIFPSPTLNTTAVLDAAERLSAEGRKTDLIAVPAMVHYYATNPTVAGRKLSSVQRIRLGGDIVTDDIIAKAKSVFPDAALFNGYGATEGSGTVNFRDEPTAPRLRGVLTVGQVAEAVSLRVVDPTDGHTLMNRGEVGDLHISGPGVIKQYLHNIKQEDFYHDAHGQWFKTGDHAVLNKDDWLFILGRSKDVIKRSAVKLSPAVIEAVLNRHPGITAQVVAMPHELHGEVPVAVVKERNEYTVDSIKQIVLDEQGPDSALGDVVFLDQLGLQDFPYNATGKVMKTTLIESLTSYRHAQLRE